MFTKKNSVLKVKNHSFLLDILLHVIAIMLTIRSFVIKSLPLKTKIYNFQIKQIKFCCKGLFV